MSVNEINPAASFLQRSFFICPVIWIMIKADSAFDNLYDQQNSAIGCQVCNQVSVERETWAC